jgi:DNA-binding MarR family transcriptional regulator
LDRDGFVGRHHDASDRRTVRVTMTDRGQALIYDAIKRQTERERAWTSLLTERELATLLRLLAKLVSQPTP